MLTDLLDRIPHDRDALLVAQSRAIRLVLAHCEQEVTRLERDKAVLEAQIRRWTERIESLHGDLENNEPRERLTRRGSIRPCDSSYHGQDSTARGR